MLIQEYQTSWVEDFNKIKRVIEEILQPLSVPIEHVGSTAVPNLAAKPIIDIDIIYEENTAIEDIKTRLEKIGYFHNGNQGIPNREVFKRSETSGFNPVLDKIVHHLYVCPGNSEELQRHILFRNYLRENEDARIFYQELKYRFAEAVKQDRKQYAALKEVKARDFINMIVEVAKKDNYL